MTEQYRRDPNRTAAVPAYFTASNDVNPICGCHLGARCDGCGVCTTCDGCYCGEDDRDPDPRRSRDDYHGRGCPCATCCTDYDDE